MQLTVLISGDLSTMIYRLVQELLCEAVAFGLFRHTFAR